MIHYFFVGAIETFQLFAQHVKLNARETRCKHQPFKNPKWTKASACNLKANSIQRVSQNLMKLFEDKSNQCKNVVPLESQDKRHTSIFPYVALYWYALFRRKKSHIYVSVHLDVQDMSTCPKTFRGMMTMMMMTTLQSSME